MLRGWTIRKPWVHSLRKRGLPFPLVRLPHAVKGFVDDAPHKIAAGFAGFYVFLQVVYLYVPQL